MHSWSRFVRVRFACFLLRISRAVVIFGLTASVFPSCCTELDSLPRGTAKLSASQTLTDTVDLSATAPAASASPAPAAAAPVDFDTLLNRLRLHVVRRRVRIMEFLRDFDRLRTGYVTKAKFITALSMAGFVVTEAEQETLAVHYAAGSEGADADRIAYIRFNDDLESGASLLPEPRCVAVIFVAWLTCSAQRLLPRTWISHRPRSTAHWTHVACPLPVLHIQL